MENLINDDLDPNSSGSESDQSDNEFVNDESND